MWKGGAPVETVRVKRAIQLHPDDTVAVVVEAVEAGEAIELFGEGAGPGPRAVEPIPYGHKVAIKPMEAGAPVIKYGEAMGIATQAIGVGAHVHVHNVRGLESQERGGILRGSL